MRYVFWALAGLILAAVASATAYMSIQIRHDIAAGMRAEKEPWQPPSPVRTSGRALMNAMDEQLKSLNARRSSDGRNGARGSIVLDPVRYERGNGMVRASGSFMDGRTTEDHSMMVVLDAYDDGHRYMTSAGSPINGIPMASTPFLLSMPDVDVFASFSIRILDRAGSELTFLSPQQVSMRERAQKGSSRVLMDDLLPAADWGEVILRMRRLGYLRDDQWPGSGPALNAILNRFRKDRGLPALNFVDVGALLALRTETPEYKVPLKDAALL